MLHLEQSLCNQKIDGPCYCIWTIESFDLGLGITSNADTDAAATKIVLAQLQGPD